MEKSIKKEVKILINTLVLKKYGNLTTSATKEQIINGEKKTYKPVFNKTLLEKVIERASVNLSNITNVDTWIDDLKTEGI